MSLRKRRPQKSVYVNIGEGSETEVNRVVIGSYLSDGAPALSGSTCVARRERNRPDLLTIKSQHDAFI